MLSDNKSIVVDYVRGNEVYDIFLVVVNGVIDYVRYPRSSSVSEQEVFNFYSA
jgi:hypothetical protein